VRVAAVGSGRSVHVLGRCAALAARGHEVRLVTAGPVLDGHGLDVRTRPLPRTPWTALQAARDFLEDVRSFRPDLLHLHYAGGKLGTLANLTGVRPFVVTVMGGDVLPEQHPGGLSPLEAWATRRIFARADLVLAKSDALRGPIRDFGRYAGRVEVVRWGVDPGRFRRDEPAAAALRARLGLRPTDRVVLSPRPLRPLYNVDVVLDAMPGVLSRVPDAVLLVTEYNVDAAYRDGLAGRGTPLGDRVRFVGHIDQADMPGLYSLAEVVVSLASSDGLPQVLLEAVACQAPVVLSRLASYDEVTRGVSCASLVEVAAAPVADAVVAILRSPRPEVSLREGREHVLALATLPSEAARVEGYYGELLAAASPRTAVLPGAPIEALSLLLRRR
jgi:glycosyltransferase involved in cell wall biosynthesis